MFARRESRPDAGAVAPAVAGLSSAHDEAAFHAMQERLHRLQDEESWNSTQARELVRYNFRSVAFYLLSTCSLCFALLNGHHGWTSSGANVAGVSAIVIGALYFAIELTVPISAHMMSWSAGGGAKWMVRLAGTCAFCLGVSFSLLILQGKFSSGADTATAQSEAKAALYATDRSALKTTQERIALLTPRVNGQSPESLMTQMKALMATQLTKRETLAEATEECQGNKRTSQAKELCTKYDALRTMREDAVELRKLEEKLAGLTTNLADTSRATVKNSDVQDRVIASVIGVDLGNVQMFKASAIALAAALLTHLLWAAYGAMANATIARRREAVLEGGALRRANELAQKRAEAEEAARQAKLRETAEQTTANFLAAKGSNQRIAEAVASSPLKEQPVVIQVQNFFVERALMGDGFSQAVSICWDDYSVWAKHNGIPPVAIDRFIQLVKDIGLHVSADARIIGAALKPR